MASELNPIVSSSGDYHLNLTSETAAAFKEAMSCFLKESGCSMGAIIERSGAIIVSETGLVNRPPTAVSLETLGVLSAGLFASTQMIAEKLGEENSPEVICHGEESHVFVAPISEEFAVLAVFPDRVAVGLVRMHAKAIAQQVIPVLRQVMKSSTTFSTATGAVVPSDQIEAPFLQYT